MISTDSNWIHNVFPSLVLCGGTFWQTVRIVLCSKVMAKFMRCNQVGLLCWRCKKNRSAERNHFEQDRTGDPNHFWVTHNSTIHSDVKAISPLSQKQGTKSKYSSGLQPKASSRLGQNVKALLKTKCCPRIPFNFVFSVKQILKISQTDFKQLEGMKVQHKNQSKQTAATTISQFLVQAYLAIRIISSK